jgi:hypothetical protein
LHLSANEENARNKNVSCTEEGREREDAGFY